MLRSVILLKNFILAAMYMPGIATEGTQKRGDGSGAALAILDGPGQVDWFGSRRKLGEFSNMETIYYKGV